ncbi:hypothetical protein [Bdellovibrio bacteriovorus]|uniref:hypothetical protein n=1 Tax=Bdellovibrio bacteriovorus TaxID=959 RepID=UPI0035A737CF
MKIYIPALITTFLAAMTVHAATTTGSIGVSLTIVDAGKTSSSAPTSPSDLQSVKSLSVLTDAANGAMIDVLLNGQKIASVPSQNGVIHFNVDLQDAESINFAFKSNGKTVHVLQTYYKQGDHSITPQMSKKTYRQQIPTTDTQGRSSTREIDVQVIEISY